MTPGVPSPNSHPVPAPSQGQNQNQNQSSIKDLFEFPTNRQKVNTLQESDGYLNGQDYNMEVRVASQP